MNEYQVLTTLWALKSPLFGFCIVKKNIVKQVQAASKEVCVFYQVLECKNKRKGRHEQIMISRTFNSFRIVRREYLVSGEDKKMAG